MPELIGHTYSGVRCDVRTCDAEIRGPEMPYFEGKDHYLRLAAEAGWTAWVSRSRRFYCPDHQPKAGHKMWQLSPRRSPVPDTDCGKVERR